MVALICPKCGLTNLRRSHTRGVGERFKKIWGLRAFRCQTKDCNWRGLVKVKSARENFIDLGKKYGKFIIILLIFLILLFIAMRFIFYRAGP